jgi:hypothetical protein
MCKLPEGFQLSDADKAKLLLAYHHLDELIKETKLSYNDAPVPAERVHHETCGNRVASVKRKAS